MRAHKYILALAAVFVVLSAGLHAGPARYVPIAKLVPQADVIVVGRLESVSGPEPKGVILGLRESPALWQVTISATRVLKGKAVSGERLDVFWEGRNWALPLRREADRVTGIWFLNVRPGGGWLLLPVMTGDLTLREVCRLPALPVAPPAPFDYSPDADVLGKIVGEVGAFLEASEGRTQLPLQMLWAAIHKTGSNRLPETYARFAKSPVVKLRGFGLAGLIAGGDVSAVQQYASEVVAFPHLDVFDAILISPKPDPAAVAAYGSIVASSAPWALKSDAAYALRVVHTREALPFLAALLDAEDSHLRYQGMAGLAEFANGLSRERRVETAMSTGLPSGPYTTAETQRNFVDVPGFRKNEQQYIQFWKHWWAEFQAK